MTPEQILFEVDAAVQAAGLPPLDADTLREVHRHLQHPKVQQALQSGQLTSARIAQEALAAHQASQIRPTTGAGSGGSVFMNPMMPAPVQAMHPMFRPQMLDPNIPRVPGGRSPYDTVRNT